MNAHDLHKQQEGNQEPIMVDRDILLSLRKTEVFVRKWPSPGVRNEYFKLMVPEIPVILCPACNHFFHEEDFEMASIQKRRCPVCRASSESL
jgi:intraflagellar transport protein 122